MYKFDSRVCGWFFHKKYKTLIEALIFFIVGSSSNCQKCSVKCKGIYVGGLESVGFEENSLVGTVMGPWFGHG